MQLACNGLLDQNIGYCAKMLEDLLGHRGVGMGDSQLES